MVLAQDVSTDRDILLEKECGLGVLPLGLELIRPAVARLREAILDLTGQAGEAAEVLEVEAGVADLPVVLAQGACDEVELLLGQRDGLGEPTRAPALADCSVKLLDTLLQVGVRSGSDRGRRVLTSKLVRCRPRKGAQGKTRQGDREGSGGRPPHGSPRLGVKVV